MLKYWPYTSLANIGERKEGRNERREGEVIKRPITLLVKYLQIMQQCRFKVRKE